MKLIALQTIKYNDSRSILGGYSDTMGRVSLSVPAGRGREAARVRALTMPLSIVECEVAERHGRDIMPIRGVVAVDALVSLRQSPLKQMIALFLAEALGVILQGNEADGPLFDFVATSVRLLDALPEERIANYHITFLSLLSSHLGIRPDTEAYSAGKVFDMPEGVWLASPPLSHHHWLDTHDSAVARTILRLNYSNMHRLRLTRDERRRMLERVLEYYALHIDKRLTSLKSVDILCQTLA